MRQRNIKRKDRSLAWKVALIIIPLALGIFSGVIIKAFLVPPDESDLWYKHLSYCTTFHQSGVAYTPRDLSILLHYDVALERVPDLAYNVRYGNICCFDTGNGWNVTTCYEPYLELLY